MNSKSEVVTVAGNLGYESLEPVVFVVDDNPAVRDSLESLISSAGWRVVLFAAVKDFLAYSGLVAPNCLVLRMKLAEVSGHEFQELLASRADVPVILITGFSQVLGAIHALNAGAFEFLTKPFRDQQLLSAIPRAVEFSRHAMIESAQMLALQDRYASLSERQREVMNLVVSGLLNKQIAFELGIKELTVKVHRGKMMRKMRADSLAELVTMAVRMQLVSLRSRRRYEQMRTCSALDVEDEMPSWFPSFSESACRVSASIAATADRYGSTRLSPCCDANSLHQQRLLGLHCVV